MRHLYLFTVFHANFGFSSIPPSHYSRIIDRCFWPVMDMLDRQRELKLGVEFPAESLSIVAAEDPLLLEAVKRYQKSGQLEVVGSGMVQSILPLIPERANRYNLLKGQDLYEALLGGRPVTAFANEQVVSSSLLKLYRECGFQAVVFDWDNAQLGADCASGSRYHPLLYQGNGAQPMAVLWNSTVAFQKFQRYLDGEVTLDEYFSFLAGHWSPDEDRLLCLYGGDWEVLDYRPGDIDVTYRAPSEGRVEQTRLSVLAERIAADCRFKWALPREMPRLVVARPGRELSSAAHPLPTKKQPRYNPTRWAVSGRASPTANAECFLLYRYLRKLEALDRAGLSVRKFSDGALPWLWDELCSLWGSDFRTQTTTEKWLVFERRMGHAVRTAEMALSRASRELAQGRDLAIFNPGASDWEGRPLELVVHFAPGTIPNLPTLVLNGKPVVLQVEETERYRDGSLRKARLVFCPEVRAGGVVEGTFYDAGGKLQAEGEHPCGRIATEQGVLLLNCRRGATIRQLSFGQICRQHLAGTISHGSFPLIDLTPDWYSGGLIVIDQNGEKITDLAPAALTSGLSGESAPIRVSVRCRVETKLGPLWKTYHLYRGCPRVDLRYHLRLADLRPKVFRMGILTINPEAFDRQGLRYSTTNGYSEVESFSLVGQRVEHDQQVSFTVSARGCVGATEGWIDVSDGKKGIAILRDLSELYTVPLVHYQEVDETYLLRIYLSAGESDETSAVLWRGHLEAGVTYLGHNHDLAVVRREAEAINLGLQVGWGRPDRVNAT